MFAGNLKTGIEPGSLEDRVMAQMPPLPSYGTQFLVTPLNEDDTTNFVKLVASNGNTRISFSNRGDVTLSNAGDIETIEITSPTLIESDRPVLAVLFVEYVQLGASSAVLTPITQFQYGYQFVAISDNSYTSYLTVTVDGRYRDSIRVDGELISDRAWESVSGSDYDVASVELENDARYHYVYSDDQRTEFGALVHSVSNECGLIYTPGMCLREVSYNQLIIIAFI